MLDYILSTLLKLIFLCPCDENSQTKNPDKKGLVPLIRIFNYHSEEILNLPSTCDNVHASVLHCLNASACFLRIPSKNPGRRILRYCLRKQGCVYRYGPRTNGRG